MPATVNWLWFGNQPQVNSDPGTPLSQADADSTIGYTAFGPNQIRAVEVTGETRTIITGYDRWGRPITDQAFATTYNGHANGPSNMTYDSPSAGGIVTSQITGFASVRYQLTMPDGTTREETGVGIQMANGDVFFRPSRDSVNDWDDIEGLRGVTVISATPLPSTIYAATISFNPNIFDIEIVPCFTAGTMIRTPDGQRPVEALAVGDLVWTRDHGPQPIRWRGTRRLGADALAANPKLRPIRIRAGALGAGQPAQDLVVSPQHRILVRSAIAARMFGAAEILVPAKQLLEIPGIEIDHEAAEVTYLHLMFDHHEVLMSNGAETESLYPGPMAVAALGAEAEAEIRAIFPELLDDPQAVPGARPFVAGKRARKLAARHSANGQPLAS